jgi:TolA-binding protein
MKLTPFLCLILVLTAVWMQVYFLARQTFSGVRDLEAEVERLKITNEREHLEMALEREQFLEFRQYVATLMPDVLKQKGQGEQGYPYRNLASTISRKEAEIVRQAIAKTLFEHGKEYYRKKEYAKAGRSFQQIIDRYEYSPYVAESFFLLAESHFQRNELEECTSIIQRMVELFPHHEMTGYALIRLGRIYEIQHRTEDAVDIYRTVLRSYPQRDVASQARASLRGIEL